MALRPGTKAEALFDFMGASPEVRAVPTASDGTGGEGYGGQVALLPSSAWSCCTLASRHVTPALFCTAVIFVDRSNVLTRAWPTDPSLRKRKHSPAPSFAAPLVSSLRGPRRISPSRRMRC